MAAQMGDLCFGDPPKAAGLVIYLGVGRDSVDEGNASIDRQQDVVEARLWCALLESFEHRIVVRLGSRVEATQHRERQNQPAVVSCLSTPHNRFAINQINSSLSLLSAILPPRLRTNVGSALEDRQTI